MIPETKAIMPVQPQLSQTGLEKTVDEVNKLC